MLRLSKIAFALAAPLLLASCLLSPGRFTATLDIGRDRSFTFTYAGEAIVTNPGTNIRISTQGEEAEQSGPETPEEMPEADRRRVIEALSREVGYRSVEYIGENRFRIDYAISGRLDRSFAFPLNPEGTALLPWLLVEVRRDGTAQITGAAFGEDEDEGDENNADLNNQRQGTFTLTTDADLVRHNSQSRAAPGERATLVWNVTPEPNPAPSALLRFAD